MFYQFIGIVSFANWIRNFTFLLLFYQSMLFCSHIEFKEYTWHHDDHCNNTSCRTDPATMKIKAVFNCFCMTFITYTIVFILTQYEVRLDRLGLSLHERERCKQKVTFMLCLPTQILNKLHVILYAKLNKLVLIIQTGR